MQHSILRRVALCLECNKYSTTLSNNDYCSGREKQNAPQEWSRSRQNIHSTSGNSTRRKTRKEDWTGLSIPNNINILFILSHYILFLSNHQIKMNAFTTPKTQRKLKDKISEKEKVWSPPHLHHYHRSIIIIIVFIIYDHIF